MHEKDLSLAHQLATNRRGDLLVAARAHEGEDWVPILRRRRERRHFANTGDGHLEGARDRCRTHRKDVDTGF